MLQKKNPKEEEFTRNDGKLKGDNLCMDLFGRRLKDRNWRDPLWVRQDDEEDIAY